MFEISPKPWKNTKLDCGTSLGTFEGIMENQVNVFIINSQRFDIQEEKDSENVYLGAFSKHEQDSRGDY